MLEILTELKTKLKEIELSSKKRLFVCHLLYLLIQIKKISYIVFPPPQKIFKNYSKAMY